MGDYILAHDIGTTGDKATLFSSDGRLLCSEFSPYGTYYPRAGWAEQRASDYWKSFCITTKRIIEKSGIKPSEIVTVSFSGQMMAALPVDKNGIPLRNCIIWADLRSTEQVERISEKVHPEQVYRITGHRLSASYSASKIMWIREKEPHIYTKAYKFIHPKDFLLNRLTGKFVTDLSDASGMNLLDINTLNWSDEMLQATGISISKLPEVREAVSICGRVISKASEDCALMEGMPVSVGGGDGVCATCGAGVLTENEGYIYLGTSTWMGLATEKPVLDPLMRTFTFCHIKRGLYFPAGTMQSGGGSLQWFKNALCDSERDIAKKEGKDVYEILNTKASGVQCGSEGLIFLPYLMGERSPHWNPDARGCFIGLNVRHKKEHMLRAVFEGVCFNMKLIKDAFSELGYNPGEIRVIGGGAKSKLWRQIMADVLGVPVVRLNFIEEATSVGAAMIGGLATGVFSDLKEAAGFVKKQETNIPDNEKTCVYKRLFDIFQKSYKSLIDVFSDISGFQVWL